VTILVTMEGFFDNFGSLSVDDINKKLEENYTILLPYYKSKEAWLYKLTCTLKQKNETR